MEDALKEIQTRALTDIAAAADLTALETLRVGLMGRSGSVSVIGEQMKTVPKEQRPIFGKLLNETRNSINAALEARQTRGSSGRAGSL